MLDQESIIRAVETCFVNWIDRYTHTVPLSDSDLKKVRQMKEDALALLKAQEPRLVAKEDFKNADRWGYLPVYVEDRDGTGYWDCITDAALGDTVSRFWTMKPTDEQRKAVEWGE